MATLLKFDRTAIEYAIKAAELRTSGEIRVYVERRAQTDCMGRAKAVFQELGMTATKERTGVLLYVNLRQRQLVVLGDTGINDKVAPSIWNTIRDQVLACFKRGDMTVGVVLGIMLAAEELAKFFPNCGDGSCNQLPDSVVVGD